VYKVIKIRKIKWFVRGWKMKMGENEKMNKVDIVKDKENIYSIKVE
jgi:hypothetical protein